MNHREVPSTNTWIMRQNTLYKLYIPILITVVLVLYTVTLRHGFVWDDNVYVLGNKAYQNFDIEKIIFSRANGVEYLPLRDLSLAMDYHIWGERPFGFHLTNLILFLLNILMIYLFAAELPFAGDDIPQRKHAAFLTALLFAVHPLISESVNLITFRNVLLSGAAFFLAAYIFARDLNKDTPFSLRVPALLSLCFLAALFSKATSIVLPLVLLLIAMFSPSRRTIRQQAITLAPLFIMAGLFFILYRAVAIESRIIDGQLNVPLSDKIATAIQIPFFYAYKFLIPAGFSAEYAADRFSQILAGPEVVMPFIGIIAFSAIAILLRRKMPVIGFALLWYGITLLPVSNLFGTNPVVADRYAYLPAFAFMFLTAFMLTRLSKQYPAYSTATMIVLAIVLGIITFTRNLDWRSDVTLWQANIKTEPANAKGYQNLVAEAIIAGDIPTAQKILAKGRLIAPSPTYDYLEGTMYYRRHNLAMALKSFIKAVEQDSNHIRGLLNIGMIYQEMGNFDKAAEYYRRTVEANAPDGWGCREQARKQLDSIADFTGSNR